jgi:hypothetical protein
MTCTTFQADGVTFITCNRCQRDKRGKRLCRACGQIVSTLRCDYPLRGRKAGKACDTPLCAACAVRQPGRHPDGETIDYCPVHDRVVSKNADRA